MSQNDLMQVTAIRAETVRRLAWNVRRLRETRGLSQVALAALVKMGRPRLNLLEQGKQDPHISTVVRIAKALKVPVAKLLE